MGKQQSKEKLLYEQVRKGNIEKIRDLRRKGVGLEWVDKQGDTPLMVACMYPKLIHVARTLIELGADVNAAPPNSRGGTPICNAAVRGLDQTVSLLLSHGAMVTASINGTNSALDIARRWSFGNVVRVIENHTCLFSGLLREVHYPRYLAGVDPPWLSGQIWAVVIYGCRDKLELRIYYSAQDAHPREVISLWEAKLEEPNFHHTEPSLVIVGKSSKHKFFSASDGDNQLLRRFSDACKGIHQEIHHSKPNSLTTAILPANAPLFTSEDEDIELAMALSASIQYCVEEARPQCLDTQISSGGSTSIIDQSSVFEAGSSSNHPAERSHPPSIVSKSTILSIPEGTEDQMNSVVVGGHYAPTNVGSNNIATAMTSGVPEPAKTGVVNSDVGGTSATSCIICYDAPREGACIPCGHMVGCVPCLKEIKANNWGCPVCRNKIDGVIKIYGV
ncbi:hypothetical protein MKW98_010534 [Papaver atlanticum]|uniref:RING-type domain-containing protein n=1 Tax=Papaver atlanticum TaxID=357466 RepID=A0AAD4X7X4_9MAGN|nr:hypothetical protein MKW98_010534 [Papaver atlanticum]